MAKSYFLNKLNDSSKLDRLETDQWTEKETKKESKNVDKKQFIHLNIDTLCSNPEL
jgi:hypothetical protein